ncbi:hypothetical protein B0T25DRAFT_580350 [Lasiosphaeria hispida]|uniref:Uncharacterized protein n=1 Tax=Lasiosphaeria hispida TaxID=260671 RepID=A0AAJ0HGV0_9PEZI|nr:hypothetical protein B0T25DRAFT_580350 [Lasiosphaeria hispida]
MSGSGGSTILAPLDDSSIQAQGLLRQGSSSGSHRLHKRRLNRSSDEEYFHIPLSIPQSICHDSRGPRLPRNPYAYWISASKADDIWSRWTNWPAGGPRREINSDNGGLQVPLLGFIIGRVTRSNKPDTAGESDTQWYTCLDACCVASDTQAAIMDSNFTYLRPSRSCLDR